MQKIDIVAKKSDRILKVLERECPNVLFSAFNNALRKRDVIVNGNRIKDNITVMAGDSITVYVPDQKQKEMFKIFYEDDNILIVNKFAGIEVCDGETNVQSELKKQGKNVKAVHRLDRNTTGLVVFAKNRQVEDELISAVKNKQIQKYYLAEVYGVPTKKEEILKAFLLKDKETSTVKVFKNKVQGAEEITTSYSLIKTNGTTSLLRVKITEGKTHQIRAHLAYVGLPILGDGKYGKNEINKKYKLKTQSLKAYELVFNLPESSSLSYLNNQKFKLNEF